MPPPMPASEVPAGAWNIRPPEERPSIPTLGISAAPKPRWSRSPPVGQAMPPANDDPPYQLQPAAVPSPLQLVTSYVPARAATGNSQARAKAVAINADARARQRAKVLSTYGPPEGVVFQSCRARMGRVAVLARCCCERLPCNSFRPFARSRRPQIARIPDCGHTASGGWSRRGVTHHLRHAVPVGSKRGRDAAGGRPGPGFRPSDSTHSPLGNRPPGDEEADTY